MTAMMATTAGPATEATGRVVVVGSGIVGRKVVRLLGSTQQVVVRRSTDFTADVSGDVEAGDVVVLATAGAHAPVAAQLARSGVSVVSVADSLGDIRELLDLDDHFRAADATLVVGAAMAPGISGLIARFLASQLEVCDEIHVAVHATAGPACARQHHRALGGRAFGWHDGAWIERPAGSGRELAWFPEPVGAHDCYRAELADPLLLHRTFPEVARLSARVTATRRDRLTARLPMLRPPHPEGGVGALRVEVRGADASGARVVAIAGVAEFVGAAAGAMAAVAAQAVRHGAFPTGAVVTSDAGLDTVALLDRIRERGVRLQEFSGVPQRA
ncbi:hypothetical protein BH23ACT3_BH23ACT3_21400 [soil metagenome]